MLHERGGNPLPLITRINRQTLNLRQPIPLIELDVNEADGRILYRGNINAIRLSILREILSVPLGRGDVLLRPADALKDSPNGSLVRRRIICD